MKKKITNSLMVLLIFAGMLSNGYNAIDALSAGAVTEKAQAPILLVRKDSIPSKVRSMVDNNSSKAVLLGGVNTISSWVESSLNK
jgi:iron transport-associated domain protein|nr:cell wall-binding repeat-containing protein [uncultured Peptostreptococcus sp.]